MFQGRGGWLRFSCLSRRSLSFPHVGRPNARRILGCCQICCKPSAISHRKGLGSWNNIMIPSAALNGCSRDSTQTWWKCLGALMTPGTMCLLLPARVSKATWSQLTLRGSRRAPKKAGLSGRTHILPLRFSGPSTWVGGRNREQMEKNERWRGRERER